MMTRRRSQRRAASLRPRLENCIILLFLFESIVRSSGVHGAVLFFLYKHQFDSLHMYSPGLGSSFGPVVIDKILNARGWPLANLESMNIADAQLQGPQIIAVCLVTAYVL
jgi:hypothetical protein